MTRNWLALGVLTLAVLLIGVDGTVLALATPFIGQDLGATGTQILWIGDIYSFVLAALLVTMGSIGDRIGHKKLLLCGATLFGVVSAVTAYAPTAELLIVARALLGVAGATLAPATLALIRGLFPQPRERSIAVGIWASAFSAGAAFGPVLGGFLLEHFWWGSVFLINVPVMVVLLVGGIVLLPEHRNPQPGPWDLPSVGLSMLGMLGVVYAIKEGAANGLRIDIVAAGVVGAAALVLFVRRQLRLPIPLIDVRLFSNRRFSGVVAANLLSVLGLSGALFFLSQFFQLVQGYSPLKAGLAELPAAVAATIFGVLAGVAVRSLVATQCADHRAGVGRRRDGVADSPAPTHRVSASRRVTPGTRRRPRIGVHGRQRRHHRQRAEGTRRRRGRGLRNRVRTRHGARHRHPRLHRDRRLPRFRRSARHPILGGSVRARLTRGRGRRRVDHACG